MPSPGFWIGQVVIPYSNRFRGKKVGVLPMT
jgi:hypothetical protein